MSGRNLPLCRGISQFPVDALWRLAEWDGPMLLTGRFASWDDGSWCFCPMVLMLPADRQAEFLDYTCHHTSDVTAIWESEGVKEFDANPSVVTPNGAVKTFSDALRQLRHEEGPDAEAVLRRMAKETAECRSTVEVVCVCVCDPWGVGRELE